MRVYRFGDEHFHRYEKDFLVFVVPGGAYHDLIDMRYKSILSNLAQLGWGRYILCLMSRVLARATGGWARLVCYQLVAQPTPGMPGRLCHYSGQSSIVRRIEATDPLVAQFPRPPEVIARRFNDGAICLAATSGERFAGFLWLAHGAYEEDEVRCRYELVESELSVWDFDVYVEPAFRMGRTFARLWDTANVYMAEKGVKWSFSRISLLNVESLSAHARLGLHRLFSAFFLCFGRVQIAVIGVPPFVHVSGSERSRPILRLRPPVTSSPAQ